VIEGPIVIVINTINKMATNVAFDIFFGARRVFNSGIELETSFFRVVSTDNLYKFFFCRKVNKWWENLVTKDLVQ